MSDKDGKKPDRGARPKEREKNGDRQRHRMTSRSRSRERYYDKNGKQITKEQANSIKAARLYIASDRTNRINNNHDSLVWTTVESLKKGLIISL